MSKLSSNLSDMKAVGINTNLVKELTKEGWKFWLQTWEDRHKNDSYHELHFQSPNMKKDASVHPSYFGEMTRAYLLDREAYAVSVDWVDALFNDKLVIQNPVSEALRKHFKKTKNCKVDYIYSTDIDFQVMVAPKTQTKLKKVKVNIIIE